MKNNRNLEIIDSVSNVFFFDHSKELKHCTTKEELEVAMHEATEEYNLLRNHYEENHPEIAGLLDYQFKRVNDIFETIKRNL